MSEQKRFETFEEFFPFYLSEHSNPLNRVFHYAGTLSVLALIVYAVVTTQFLYLLAVPFVGYGPAWIGHFIIERNRPATFTYPAWSLRGDFKMLALFLTGRLKRALPSSEDGQASLGR